MPLWGTTHDAITNKPKWLPVDENSDNRKADVYATNAGWVQAAGSAASGNDSTTADPEVLVAIGMLAGKSATTGLKTPTVTAMRFIVGTSATTDFTAGDNAQTLTCQVTWDEQITVTGAPTIRIANGNQGSGVPPSPNYYDLVYTGNGSTANRKRFTLTGQTIKADDVLTMGGANITLAGGTLKDQGATPSDASVVLSGVTAVTHTVLA